MEFAERNLNDYDINKTAEKRWSRSEITSGSNFGPATTDNADVNLPHTITERVSKAIFNKDLSRNLELLLFDDKLFTPVKTLKASINYKLFGRVTKEVAVSSDKKRLLMSITVDTTFRESGFRKLAGNELAQLAANLDRANKYYLSIGFKKVFLSVVPNAVSVYDEKRMAYNHLLELVEHSNRFPVISIFHKFKTAPVNLYYRSDTHWNPAGLDIWITQVNKTFNTR
jgi:hypothetical protein